MQNNGDIGYTVASDPQDTGRGFKVLKTLHRLKHQK
jgi:hypothetical protein